MRRGATCAALLGLAALLTSGCTGGGGDRGREGAPSGSTQGTPSASSTPTAEVAARLPNGPLASELSYRVPKLVSDRSLLYPSVRFTDRYVVAATATNRLRVVDRDSMEQLWTAKIPFADQHTGVCTLPQLARDATTVTVFVGLRCNQLRTYDLATGELVEEFLGDPVAVEGYGLVGDSTYWAGSDSVNMIDDTGHNIRLIDLYETGLKNQSAQILDATTNDDASLMVLGVNTGHGTGTQQFIGLHLDGIDSEVAWKRRTFDLGLPKSFRVIDVSMPDREGGLVEARAPHDRFAFGLFDPDTGSIADRYVIAPPLLANGLPGLIDDTYEDDYVVDGDALYANLSEAHSHGFEKIVRYDLARHRVDWKVLVPFLQGEKRDGYAIDVKPLGLSADGRHLYGLLNAGAAQQDLFELDAATGRQTGRWAAIDDRVVSGDVAVDGDLVVEFAHRLYLKKEYELDVKRAS